MLIVDGTLVPTRDRTIAEQSLYVRPLPDGGGKTIVACLPL